MNDNLNYETYLFISPKKLIISVNDDLTKKIHEETIVIEENINKFIFEKLDYFLNQNIYKIEKKLNHFIKKISLILDLDEFFSVEVSVKKKNYENVIDSKTLKYLLHEAKDCCKKTMYEKSIVHMTVTNYQVDNKNYLFLPEGINHNNFSLDVKFLCISDNLIKNFEKILEKYQISLGEVVSANYVKKFLTKNENELFLMTGKIIKGHNPNEVILVKKTQKNQGFFEKFFNFFN